MQGYFNTFILRLKELQGRESVSAFARRLKIPQNTLDCYMRGTRKPSLELLTRVCDTCGVSADWLLGREATCTAPREVFPMQAPVRPLKTLPAKGDVELLAEVAELKRRIDALEKSQTSPAFACG